MTNIKNLNIKDILILAQSAEKDMAYVRQVEAEKYVYAYYCGQRLSKCRQLFEVEPKLAEQAYGYDNFGQVCASPQGFNVGGSKGSRYADVANVIDYHVKHNNLKPADFFVLESWAKVYKIREVIESKGKKFTLKWIENVKDKGPHDVDETVRQYKIDNGIPVKPKKVAIPDPVDKWHLFKKIIAEIKITDEVVSFSMHALDEIILKVEEMKQ